MEWPLSYEFAMWPAHQRSGGGESGYSVLAVDDQPSVLQLLRVWIEHDDRLHLAGTAAHGLAALEWVQNRCPDAVICDADMPVLNGVEVAPLLRRACPDSVIVLFTAAPERVPHDLGVDAVMEKTTQLPALLDRVAELCQRRE